MLFFQWMLTHARPLEFGHMMVDLSFIQSSYCNGCCPTAHAVVQLEWFPKVCVPLTANSFWLKVRRWTGLGIPLIEPSGLHRASLNFRKSSVQSGYFKLRFQSHPAAIINILLENILFIKSSKYSRRCLYIWSTVDAPTWNVEFSASFHWIYNVCKLKCFFFI